MIIYITRPPAYGIYMGGYRDLRAWLQQPAYSHQSREHDLFGSMKYVDCGWDGPHTTGQPARFLLDQDRELLDAVWKEVFTSILPKGMTYEQGGAWQFQPMASENGDFDTAYQQLFSDKKWEGKCNTCNKRFLLKVDLRSNKVERIVPQVFSRRLTTDEQCNGYQFTDECDPFFATEYYHTQTGPDFIPF